MNRSLNDWLEHISRQHAKTIDMGLERMHTMLERLDLLRPAHRTVTVAGTNGKGSTCIALEQLLLAHGVAVGTTLSPHVVRFNERVRIQGCEVDDALLCTAFSEVERVREGVPVTYFEASALAALWCFRQAQVQIGILEIGLGGRLDAFNAVDADIAVITSIGFDHQEYLGDTLDLIGREKAGILRSGQAVVLGENLPASVLAECRRFALEPSIYGRDFRAAPADPNGHWTYADAARRIPGLVLGPIAAHNIALALRALGHLVEVEAPACRRAAHHMTLPGRLQQCEMDGRRYVFDVCHNREGAQFCCDELAKRSLRPGLVVCGMLRGKPHRLVYETVAGCLRAPWVLIDTRGDRAMQATELADAMAIDAPCLTDFAGVRDYVRSATSPGDVILVFGSFNAVEQGVSSHASQDVGVGSLK